ncbi:MAG: hypothetical protein V2I33_08210 [Kangiellaceae bacterium]|jgi:hypothetical protein|nr:hypothetical protein [Kangiellaceae bacterium]
MTLFNSKSTKLLFSILLCSILWAPQADARKFFRFKNSEGQTVLLDQLTPEAIRAGYEIINDQGKLVQRVPPAKTIGEQAKEKRLAKERKRQEREKQRQLKRDAELLKLFVSVDDIMRARDAALTGIDQRLELNQNEQNLIRAGLEDLQRQAADFERTGKRIPKQILDGIDNTQKEIAKRERNKSIIEQDAEIVRGRFARDMQRFQELQAQRLANRFKNDENRDKRNNMTMLTCKQDRRCRDIWQLAQIYAQKHASGRLEVTTDTLILTSAPTKDDEIGVSFSRLPTKTETQIILEVSCNPGEGGDKVCSSSEVRQIVRGFEKFISKQLDS